MVDRRPGPVDTLATELWGTLAEKLVAIIGTEGFKALLDRSLHVASIPFPWLALPASGDDIPSRLEGLAAALRGQAANEAAQATTFLLSTFTGVLGTLIGQPLTTHLLRSAWGTAFEPDGQDTTQ